MGSLLTPNWAANSSCPRRCPPLRIPLKIASRKASVTTSEAVRRDRDASAARSCRFMLYLPFPLLVSFFCILYPICQGRCFCDAALLTFYWILDTISKEATCSFVYRSPPIWSGSMSHPILGLERGVYSWNGRWLLPHFSLQRLNLLKHLRLSW